ncbi:RNase adaptor protein RapZ [Gammaproteobacteria bacterium]
MKLIIVSGLSGSGKSTALHVLEDLGYYCVDNLPVSLLPALANEMLEQRKPDYQRVAAGIDARNPPADLEQFPQICNSLREAGVLVEVFFLDADTGTLLKRFSETRRKHPLTTQTLLLPEAIVQERRLLEPLRAAAQLCFDTTLTHQHQLRDLLVNRIGRRMGESLSILFVSFGYKRGIPADADYLFDLRCLPNPHWEPHLRPLTGHDRAVAEFLEKSPLVEEMYQTLERFIDAWIPRFEANNRSYLTIALGCTGGQHRSVYFVERLGQHFRSQRPNVQIRHRELQ